MPRPLLPPRGIFVPTTIMYNHDYSPTVIHTWIQLNGLAWDRSETPQLSMNQLSEITGKSHSTLYGHMALLRSWGALRMRNSEKGTFIVSFTADSGEFTLESDSHPEQSDSEFPDSRNLEKPDPSLNLPVNHIVDQSVNNQEQSLEDNNSQEDTGEDNWEREINQLAYSRGGEVQKSGLKSRNSDTFQEFGLPPELDGADPSKVYQKVTGIRPNQYQRGQLKASIFDTNIWYSAITHWQLHGWNPKNVHGIYELYQRGGAPGCRYCSKERDSQDETLSVIQKMREEYRSRNNGNY